MSIAVLGGGYAGCAAAVTLAAAGHCVHLYEAGPGLGGRARRVQLGERCLDNGQHIGIGAYRDLLALLQQVGLRESDVFLRQPLDLHLPGQFRLRCPALPAPLHLAAALLGAQGLSWRERWQLSRAMLGARLNGYRLPEDCSVRDWLAANRQSPALVNGLWEPLTLAALNTPLHLASAQVLLNVLRDSLGGGRQDSDFLLPKVDLSRAFPDAAAAYIVRHGGEVRCNRLVQQLRQEAAGWRVDSQTATYQQLVVALPPHRLGMVASGLPPLQAVANELADWNYQPIVTVYLEYAPDLRLPQPMLGRHGGLIQWLFDRGQTHGEHGRLAVVLSAAGRHSTLSQAELAVAIDQELQQHFALPPARWSKVISEKRATFACSPGLRRPGPNIGLPGLWLAGDYLASDYPATLEGAVRSGIAAARLAILSSSN